MHNQNDGVSDWGQSAELYMALRRLGKKVWMLQYEGEGHALMQRKNALDFTIRLTQFFDYYLKDAPPPAWMNEDVSVK
jgi:dipeptidyl aminopeptidase/acylaminoacyl peptidase